jgi:hypothetical protein
VRYGGETAMRPRRPFDYTRRMLMRLRSANA